MGFPLTRGGASFAAANAKIRKSAVDIGAHQPAPKEGSQLSGQVDNLCGCSGYAEPFG